MENHIIFKGSKICYTDIPVRDESSHKGRCVVLLHGFLESMDIWKEYSKSLSGRYRIVCIDLPGHGQSESIGYVHTMEMMADCVKEVLHSLNISRCVMTGHSMGGYVTLAFAEKYESHLLGFALLHSHAAPDSDEKKKDRDRAIKVVKRNPVVLINEMIPNLFAPDNREKFKTEIEQLTRAASSMTRQSIVNGLEGMKDRADRRKLLENMKLPVLFILGKKDPIMTYELLKPQADLSKNIDLYTLENSGHMGYIEEKELCYTAIKKFIQKCHLPLSEGEE